MKLLKSAGCLLPADGGNVKEQTMIVEEQGIGFRTGVRFPSAPFKMRLSLYLQKDGDHMKERICSVLFYC